VDHPHVDQAAYNTVNGLPQGLVEESQQHRGGWVSRVLLSLDGPTS
jgi:hypothetical protein